MNDHRLLDHPLMRTSRPVQTALEGMDDVRLAATLSLACGILLGRDYPDCAAAVALAHDRLFPVSKS